jgi:hypothetical protein
MPPHNAVTSASGDNVIRHLLSVLIVLAGVPVTVLYLAPIWGPVAVWLGLAR